MLCVRPVEKKMNDYYLLMQGSKVGPLSIETVSEYLATGKISVNQMVSVNNEEFIRLYEVEGFGHLAPANPTQPTNTTQKADLANGKFVLILGNMVLRVS